MNILQEIRNRDLAAEIESEVSIVLVGPEFSHWSSDCRKSWARSVLGIIEGDKLAVKGAVLALLEGIAKGDLS